MKQQVKKAVLAFSGGLDTSIAIPWLKENYGCEVIAMAGNIGQDDDLHRLKETAIQNGAGKFRLEDLRAEFITDYLWPLLQSGARDQGRCRLGAAIARTLIARRQVEVALEEGADALVHGCTLQGHGAARFERVYETFAPELKIIAPWREWAIRSRPDAPAYAQARGIATAEAEETYRRDSNIWQLSHAGGELDDPQQEPPRDLYELTLDPRSCPDGDSEITIDFEQGVPVGLNGMAIPPVQLLEDLNEIGGTNGIGRIDLVENRADGAKTRAVYETPGGTLLVAAHRELESLCLDRQTLRQKDILSMTYAQLVDDGCWFTPLREALAAFFDKTQERVTGSVTLDLYKGNLAVVSRNSPYSLYRQDIASFATMRTRQHAKHHETLARTV